MENVKPTKEKSIRINNRDIENANQFIYLGSNTANNNFSSATKHRIHTGTNDLMDCEIYWIAKLLWKGAKCKIYNTLIRIAVFYGCQSWTITNIDEEKLNKSEKRF